jgi:predicted SprT family Zn-dependent metalloprotease
MTPTVTTYAELQQIFDTLNERLFGGSLKPCLMTLQREKQTMGYFSHRRFVASDGGGDFTDEIALNPAYFASHGLREVFQTVAHEMVHLWQAHYGSPGRGRYHNREWAEKMIEIGLMPTDTGGPGGKTTGQRISDYPIEGGPFMAAYEALATRAFRLTWVDRYVAPSSRGGGVSVAELATQSLVFGGEAREKKPTRVKYVCPANGAAVWGRPNLNLVCGDTGQAYVMKE